ncbi:hypothetical protein DICPUDRAFT_90890 [Dictyostelium purpureum]|uniref:BRCT domain-containing protein n=1 Tax=Dictyostelium purpureum TaxID=5786 RepID=F1A5H1_DICPU|nr:uncharacterized protein DICPUDRAFT_90890 [Dictyostelium purpureum]EGC28558.1 hypothetical protein DICPUDRAFT_90890 [Dictyostelium purpureum]|eukprot:XP_003294915.1 hypothetical protein DICPUDRAFT_90890 [Dictyostelium purpureum]
MVGSQLQLQPQQPIFSNLRFYLQESFVSKNSQQAEQLTRVINKHGGKRLFSSSSEGALIYLFNDFTTQEFEVAKNQGHPIIGIKYLVECAQKNRPINFDMLEQHPIYSDCLFGVVVSTFGFTSEANQEIVNIVQYLSGEYAQKLSTRVTHLIVNTEYDPSHSKTIELARNNNIPLVIPAWVSQCFQDSIIHDYRQFSAVFYNCIICTSGFQNTEKKEIKEGITCRGGTISGDYNAEVQILITNSSNSDKYAAAKANNIPIVSFEWYKDCINTGLFRDFSIYSINNGIIQTLPYQPQSKQQLYLQQQPLQQQQQQQQLYQPFQTPPSLQRQLSQSQQRVPENKYKPTPMPSTTQISKYTIPTAISTTTTNFTIPQQQHYQQQQNQFHNNNEFNNSDSSNNQIILHSSSMENELAKKQQELFYGKNILIKGFPEEELNQVILHVSKYAQVIDEHSIPSEWTSTNMDIHYIMAPHEKNINLNEGCSGIPVVTTDWFDRCINSCQIIDPNEAPIYSPLPNLSVFKGLKITSEGFSENEERPIRATAKLLGATYLGKKFGKGTTHLVCSSRGESYTLSLGKKIPVVTVDWLFESARAGRRLDETNFSLNKLISNGTENDFSIITNNNNDKNDNDKNDNDNSNNNSINIFKGFTIFISSKIIHSAEKYIKYIEYLGGEYTLSAFDKITHYITNEYDHLETQNFIDANFVQVSPKWLESCWGSKSLLSENDFQPLKIVNEEDSLPTIQSLAKTPSQLFNANSTQEKIIKTNTITTTIEDIMVEDNIALNSSSASSKGFDKIFKALSTLPVHNKQPHSKIGINKNRIEYYNQNKLSIVPKINKPSLNISSLIDWEKSERDDSDSDSEPMKIDDDSVSSTSFNSVSLNNSVAISNNGDFISDPEEDSSQNLFKEYQASLETSSQMITYGNETEILRKKKLLESYYSTSGQSSSKHPPSSTLSSNLNKGNDSVAENILNMLTKPTQHETNETLNKGPSAIKSTMIFVLSGFADSDELARYTAMLLRFGGFLESSINKDVTHVITKQPSRSEKVMGGSAAGSWILKPSFLVVSNEKGVLEKEVDHQWNEESYCGDPKIDLWINSSLKCQRIVAQNGRKIFDLARIAFSSKNIHTFEAWKKILSCGNAELFEVGAIKSLDELKDKRITHYIYFNTKETDPIYNLIDKNPSAGIQVLLTNTITKHLNNGEYLIPLKKKKKS